MKKKLPPQVKEAIGPVDALLEQPVQERIYAKRTLWCSQPGWERMETLDYHADKLTMLHIDDGQFALELKVGGRVVRLPVINTDKYVM